jgi:hypothetical protein
MEQTWEWARDGRRLRTRVPEIMSRGHATHSLRVVKQRAYDGTRREERFHVAACDGSTLPLDGADWVDWDQAGRLVVLRHGAVSVADVADGRVQPLRELIDLTADTFELREPPADARRL